MIYYVVTQHWDRLDCPTYLRNQGPIPSWTTSKADALKFASSGRAKSVAKKAGAQIEKVEG